MADINRKTVDKLVLHHAVTPLWADKSKTWLINWFSDNGFAQAYGSNPANWSGLHKPNGARSYSQAAYVGQRVTNATPDATAAEKKAGFRLVQLIKDPWGQITWHAGNWEINTSSMGLEILGDYRNYTLRDGDAKVIADFWRPQDQKLKGKTQIILHNEIIATICPARIKEKRNYIVKLVNEKPKEVKPVPNVTEYKKITKAKYEIVRNTSLWNFDKPKTADMPSVKKYKKGDIVELVGKATHRSGSVYLMTDYSYNAKPRITHGFNQVDLKKIEPTPPAPKPTPTPTPKPEPAPTPEPQLDPEIAEILQTARDNRSLLNEIKSLLQWVVDKLKGVFK